MDAAPGGTPFTPVTGTAIGIGAIGSTQDGGCASLDCGDVPATPVFDWDAQQYAKVYRVLISEDADFTNVVSNVVTTGRDCALTRPCARARRVVPTSGT